MYHNELGCRAISWQNTCHAQGQCPISFRIWGSLAQPKTKRGKDRATRTPYSLSAPLVLQECLYLWSLVYPNSPHQSPYLLLLVSSFAPWLQEAQHPFQEMPSWNIGSNASHVFLGLVSWSIVLLQLPIP